MSKGSTFFVVLPAHSPDKFPVMNELKAEF
jgi:hypothetical protein